MVEPVGRLSGGDEIDAAGTHRQLLGQGRRVPYPLVR